MEKQDIFILADQSLNNVIDQIRDEQWKMEMPEGFAMTTSNAKIVTLRDVINYHAYDDSWIPDMMAGKTMEEAGKNKFDGDLLDGTPKENFAAIVEKACRAVRENYDPERIVHYTYGDYPAHAALEHAIIFRGLRVHGIAQVIGIDTEMPDDLVQGLWDVIEPQAEDLRVIGVFPPKVEVPEDAPLQDRLLGLAGRKP